MRFSVLAAAFAAALAAAPPAHAAAPAAAAPPPTKIRFVTDWKAQAEHGGFYEALAEGLSKGAGLDVTIIEGGPTVNVPFAIESKAHFKPQVFLLADNGYPGYANMVFAPQTLIDANPRAVQAFVTATQTGWLRYLNGNPAPANALIKRANPEMSDALI